MSANTPTNNDDIIDSRDVIARIEELQELKDAYDEAQAAVAALDDREDEVTDEEREEAQDALDAAAVYWEEDDEQAEYKALTELAEEAEGYAADWHHGETLIRETYFKTYAQQLAEDTGAIKDDSSWPNRCIDWEQAADELEQDYTHVDFDGVTYLIR